MDVTITARAARFTRMMTRMHGAPAGAGLRLQVRAGGCSGIDSDFAIVSAPHAGDSVLERDGARLFLSAASLALLQGYTIDFRESRLDGGLRFLPPPGPMVWGCSGGPAKRDARVIPLRPASLDARGG